MKLLLLCLVSIIITLLIFENIRACKSREKIKHVIYVNGTRGKSTVTRMLDAILREAGYKVVSKTTGTVPMYIDTSGDEVKIKRRGKANIREQLWILNIAAKQKAEFLVCECMAINPELQFISQKKMLRSDIGIITNVRLDHTYEMGSTLDEICDSLSMTIPEKGIMFTADARFFNQIKRNCEKKNCKCVFAQSYEKAEIDEFEDNVAVSMAVADYLGIPETTAVAGIRKFKPDPLALSVYHLPGNAVLINGMSINDPESTFFSFEKVKKKYELGDRKTVLLINNRIDRPYRIRHMENLVKKIGPDTIWLMGDAQKYALRRIKKQNKNLDVNLIKSAESINLNEINEDCVIFAAGNVAKEGYKLIERVKKEGCKIG